MIVKKNTIKQGKRSYIKAEQGKLTGGKVQANKSKTHAFAQYQATRRNICKGTCADLYWPTYAPCLLLHSWGFHVLPA